MTEKSLDAKIDNLFETLYASILDDLDELAKVGNREMLEMHEGALLAMAEVVRLFLEGGKSCSH